MMDRIRAPRHLTVAPALAGALAKGQIGPLAFACWVVAGGLDGAELAPAALAQRCGCSLRALERALSELRTAGWYAAIPLGRGRGFLRIFAEPSEVRAVIKNYRKKAAKPPLPPEAAAWAAYAAQIRADRNPKGYERALRRALERGEPEAVASFEGYRARLALGWSPADGELWRPAAGGG